ncbi:MAG: alpha/beta fold hydrolase [Nannocystales bacterium]
MMETRASDGAKLAYRVQGDGERAILLVHGWMVSGAMWNDVLPHLNTKGVRFIIPDLRGTGASDKPEEGYTFAQLSADLLAVSDAAGAKQISAVGHSMGGQLVQYLAAHHADRVDALALLCTVPASGIPLPPEAAGLFRGCAGSPEAQRQILSMACKQLEADARGRLVDAASTVPAACMEQTFDLWTAGGFADDLAQVVAPTLVLATSDPFTPPELLNRAVVAPIAKARLATLPGPGHYVANEAPEALVAILDAFLAGTQT